jgi:hypothetical protein
MGSRRAIILAPNARELADLRCHHPSDKPPAARGRARRRRTIARTAILPDERDGAHVAGKLTRSVNPAAHGREANEALVLVAETLG